jgi:hypothetical protein
MNTDKLDVTPATTPFLKDAPKMKRLIADDEPANVALLEDILGELYSLSGAGRALDA